MSQFETINSLIKVDIDWSKVEMFHLDEYINLPIDHKASFRKYLQKRFISKVSALKAVYFVGEGEVQKNIKFLTEEIRKQDIDVGVIGIGQNAHIAFNDPPADFETKEAFKIVNLDYECKDQQVSEGWFSTRSDVPDQAISMTVHQILQCKQIISCVPYLEKADAIYCLLTSKDWKPNVPTTALKQHSN